MFVHELTPGLGRKKPAKRLGRGNASGKGNYSGKGLKGQKARTGASIPAHFEGGQTPLHRRIAKLRGFTRHPILVTTYEPINIGRLDKDVRIADALVVTKQALVDLGYIKRTDCSVKILGYGELNKKLSFTGIDAFSTRAREAVEKAGGTIA
jgi:large subunit ribosomal protein L15